MFHTPATRWISIRIILNLSLGVFLKSPALEVTPFWGSRFQGLGRLAAWSLLDGWMLRFVWPRLVSWPQDICKSSKERGTTARNHQNVLCGDVFPIPKLCSVERRGGCPVRSRRALGKLCPESLFRQIPWPRWTLLGTTQWEVQSTSSVRHCSRFFSGKLEVPLIRSLMIDDNCITRDLQYVKYWSLSIDDNCAWKNTHI